MEYIYTLSEKGNLLSFSEYTGEPLKDNQTLVQYYDYFANPCFDFKNQVWYNGEPLEEEAIKPPTPDEVLAEKVEETKHKTITEFELRKILSEQQAKTMRMIMMLAKK